MKKSFLLYTDLARSIRRLEDAAAGRVFKAIYDYVETGALPEHMEMPEAMCFDFIQNALDRDAEKYEQTRAKRVEAARRGGRKTQERNRQAAQALQGVKAPLENALPHQAVNGNENGNGNGNENVNENENENGNENENVNGNGSESVPVPAAAAAGAKAAPPSPRLYGRYQNLSFTEEEYRALREEFPTDYQERLERLSEYTASSGKQYASALATIRAWARKDKEEHHGTPEPDPYEHLGSALGTVL